MDQNKLFEFHAEETSRRLNRIEDKIDALYEHKNMFMGQVKAISAVVSVLISIVAAAISHFLDKLK